MRKAALILIFLFGSIAGASALYALNLYQVKPLVIEKETKVLGDEATISAQNARTAEKIYQQALPGVVTIRSLFVKEDGKNADVTQGSGFVLDTQGYVVTNLHVLLLDPFAKDRKAADEVYVDFADGSVAQAEIIGQDPNADIALIRIKKEPEVKLVPLKFADSDLIKTGQAVLAIGAPFGERGSASFGVVSSKDRSIQSLVSNFSINGVIQTDAAVNHGNSGGPLLNMDGQVIGINSQIRTDGGASSGNEGVAYSIPSNLIVSLLPRLREGGVLKYAYLGVTTRKITPQLARRFNLASKEGILVQQINEGSPAQQAGLNAPRTGEDFYGEQVGIGGDIILQVGNKKVTTPDQLSSIISELTPGDKVQLMVQKSTGGKVKQIIVTIGARE